MRVTLKPATAGLSREKCAIGTCTSWTRPPPRPQRNLQHDTIHAHTTRNASIAASSHIPRDGRRQHIWPTAPKGHTHPTPYQILSMDAKGPYSKARYYELVKLYHPDMTESSHQHISCSPRDRMERYRLLVAAHTILSDPVKRSAYDRFGAGWNGRSDLSSSSSSSPGPFSQSWTSSPPPSDPIWQNATWEDWERFYAQRDGTDPDASSSSSSTRYMRNSYFVALVAALAAVGSSLNYHRAQDAGTYFVEQRDLVHDRAAKELRRVRQETSGLSGREERIEFFLRQREATLGAMSGTDVEALREERARRLVGSGETCQSDGVSKVEVRDDG